MFRSHFVNAAGPVRCIGQNCQPGRVLLCFILHLEFSHRVSKVGTGVARISLVRELRAIGADFLTFQAPAEQLKYSRGIRKHIIWELESDALVPRLSNILQCALDIVGNGKFIV